MGYKLKEELLHICDNFEVNQVLEVGSVGVIDNLHKLKVVLKKIYDDKHELYKVKNPVLKKETSALVVFTGIKDAIYNIQQTIVLDTHGRCHKEPKILCNLAKDLIVKIDMYTALIKIQKKEGIVI